MLSLALVISYLLAGFALAHNSCRQCTGSNLLIFKERRNINEVKYYLDQTFGKCATGEQYSITGYTYDDCIIVQNQPLCVKWTVQLKVWRYCGNGGKAYVSRSNRCVGNVCAYDERLSLECFKSVQCQGDCRLPDCDDRYL